MMVLVIRLCEELNSFEPYREVRLAETLALASELAGC